MVALMKSPKDQGALFLHGRSGNSQINIGSTLLNQVVASVLTEKSSYKMQMEFCNHRLDQMLSEKMDLNLLNIF